MHLTAATVAVILAFTIAQAGALPSPQTAVEEAVAPTPTAAPVLDSTAAYFAEEPYPAVEKRAAPPGAGQGQPQGPGPRGGMQWNGPPANWQGGSPDGGHFEDGSFYGAHVAHGPMPDDDAPYYYEHPLARRDVNYYDAHQDWRHQIQHAGGAPSWGPPTGHLSRRSDPLDVKQYKWWQKQGNGGEVVGNPDVRNINWKDDGIINRLPWKRDTQPGRRDVDYDAHASQRGARPLGVWGAPPRNDRPGEAEGGYAY